ncbi:MAG: hypothetical protein K6C40_05370 [Thermoguttaceae bacterium]|nr:hypothetical protein [Thermoguttaceae bacterium]
MNAKDLAKMHKGKTREQIQVIDYFCKENGCLSSTISDNQYIALVHQRKQSLELRERAISKIGLEEYEIQEIPPVELEGFVFENALAKRRANGYWVSSSYQVAWLFFSSTQVYIFRCTFNMDDSRKIEETDEFFYKDVTSFSTAYETEIAHDRASKSDIEIETCKFKLVVPGDKIFISMDGVADAEDIIQAMKKKLREKKM